jgi:hypothetical protein
MRYQIWRRIRDYWRVHQKLFSWCDDLAWEYNEEDCGTDEILKERQWIEEIKQNVYNWVYIGQFEYMEAVYKTMYVIREAYIYLIDRIKKISE